MNLHKHLGILILAASTCASMIYERTPPRELNGNSWSIHRMLYGVTVEQRIIDLDDNDSIDIYCQEALTPNGNKQCKVTGTASLRFNNGSFEGQPIREMEILQQIVQNRENY